MIPLQSEKVEKIMESQQAKANPISAKVPFFLAFFHSFISKSTTTHKNQSFSLNGHSFQCLSLRVLFSRLTLFVVVASNIRFLAVNSVIDTSLRWGFALLLLLQAKAKDVKDVMATLRVTFLLDATQNPNYGYKSFHNTRDVYYYVFVQVLLSWHLPAVNGLSFHWIMLVFLGISTLNEMLLTNDHSTMILEH